MLSRTRKEYIEARIAHTQCEIEAMKKALTKSQEDLNELRQIIMDDLLGQKNGAE